jgi:iron complex outermembrane recepter protein
MSTFKRFFLIWSLLSILALGLTPGLEPGYEPDNEGQLRQPSLADSSLEELLSISVESVSRREDSLLRSSAAAFVISAEDIRRSGAQNLMDALRLAPGVLVSQIDAYNSAVSIRGFHGRNSNKVLLLVDGRNAYQQVFGGAFWALVDIPLMDVERIEVIRGPGGSMWGVNAMNGVINVITRHSSNTQGGYAGVATAVDAPRQGIFRYGFRPQEKLSLRLWGKHDKVGHSLNADATPAEDEMRREAAGFRADWEPRESDSLRITGDTSRTRYVQLFDFRHVTLDPSSAFTPGQNWANGGSLMGRWTHRFKDGSESTVNAWISRYAQSEFGQRGAILNNELEWTYSRKLTRRHTLLAGAGWMGLRDSLRIALFGIASGNRNTNISSAFVQDRYELFGGKLQFEGGIRAIHYTATGAEFQPRGSVLFVPSKKTAFWASAARAVRIPSRYELLSGIPFSYRLPGTSSADVRGVLRAPDNLENEAMRAFEGGWRFQAKRRYTFDLAVFRNQYSNLIGERIAGFGFCQPVHGRPCISLQLDRANGRAGDNWGYELISQWQRSSALQFHGSWTRFRSGKTDAAGFSPSPVATDFRWLNQGQFWVRTKTFRHWEFDAQWFYTGRTPDTALPAWNRVDLRLGRQLRESFSFSAGVRNLTSGNGHLEMENRIDDYVAALYRRRAAWLRFEYRF